MKKPKKPKTVFAELRGELYIETPYCGIHFLVITTDGLMVTLMGDKAYMKVTDAIDWHRNEIEETKGRHRRDFLDALTKQHELFLAEKNTTPQNT